MTNEIRETPQNTGQGSVGLGKCRRCKRILKNPQSVVNGMGPVCWKKMGIQGNVAVAVVRNGRGSNYRIVGEETTPEKLVIRDIGPWDQYFTVTNDAENVVAELASQGYLNPGRQLFYYDSDGSFNELLIKDGKFNGFKYAGPKP